MALVMNTVLSVEQRLSKAMADIMAVDPAIAPVLMIGKRVVCDKTQTACTNGRDEKYGRAFCEALSDAELRFVMMHEGYHKMYRHLKTWRHLWKINAKRANKACDYVINIKLYDGYLGVMTAHGQPFIKMPVCGLLDPKYRDMDSEEVFYMLEDEEGDDEQGEGEGKGNGDGDSLDEHDWEDAQDMPEEESKQLERDIEDAVRQGGLAAGKMGSKLGVLAKDVLTPKVDWRKQLRDFSQRYFAGTDISTWAKPNRRYIGAGIYMPSSYSKQMRELVIAYDASGSTMGRIGAQFLGEVQRIATTLHIAKVRLIYWDTAVCGDEVYTPSTIKNIIQSTKPSGGGGTVVQCVPDYLAANGINPQAIVVLTDGELGGDWGSKWSSVPLLWCVVNRRKIKSKVGKTINITDY